MHHDLLIALPYELTTSLLTVWLRVQEVTAVDSAFCNRDKRRLLQSILTSSSFVVSAPPGSDMPASFTRWLCLREIRVDTLVVASKYYPDCIGLCEKFGTSIRHLTLRNMDHKIGKYLSTIDCGRLIRSCTMVSTLVMDTCYIDAATMEAISELSDVGEVRLQSCYDRPGDNLDLQQKRKLHVSTLDLGSTNPSVSLAMLQACSPVHVQSLDICEVESLDLGLLSRFFSQSSKLTKLCLEDVTNNALTTLLQSCPQVQHLELFNCLSLTDESAAPIAQTLTNLKSLDVTFTEFTDVLLEELALHCAGTLETLHISNCFGMSGEGLTTLLEACGHNTHGKLTTLHMSLFEGLVFDTAHLGRLTTLSVTMEDVEASYFIRNVLPYCTSLHHLEIQAYDIDVDDFASNADLFPEGLLALDLISVVSVTNAADCCVLLSEVQEAFPSVAVTLKEIVD